MKTGELIRQLRLQKGMTQEELAAKTDISVRTIQRIENNEVDPRAFTLQAIAAALEVEFEALNAAEAATPTPDRESFWIPLLHLSGLLLLIIPPILIWLWKRDASVDMRRHFVAVMNYQLSMTLYLLPCALLSVYPILLVFGLYSQVMIIVNTVRVGSGEPFKYPLSIRFFRNEPAVLV